jgi:hypothetical protein
MEHADLRFYGTWRGRKIYRVMEDGRVIFTGTKGECRRFLRIHREKSARDLKEPASPRRRKILVKRYRVSPRRALPA